MKDIKTLFGLSVVAIAIICAIPTNAHACYDGCYGNYGTYYSSAYYYSGPGVNYPYQSPTYYRPSYYVSDPGYNYNYYSYGYYNPYPQPYSQPYQYGNYGYHSGYGYGGYYR
ncbi:MAG: hypothetical protein KGJ35_00640 [Patescibacteria group bacterium]|nr:hypothetical protein [Patescibacteria group bacterium]